MTRSGAISTKSALTLTFWIIPVMSVIVNGITYAAALGMEIEVGIIISIQHAI